MTGNTYFVLANYIGGDWPEVFGPFHDPVEADRVAVQVTNEYPYHSATVVLPRFQAGEVQALLEVGRLGPREPGTWGGAAHNNAQERVERVLAEAQRPFGLGRTAVPS